MCGSKVWVNDCHTFVSYFQGFNCVCHSACFWRTLLKLGRITNFDMLFLVMGFISLDDEINLLYLAVAIFAY